MQQWFNVLSTEELHTKIKILNQGEGGWEEIDLVHTHKKLARKPISKSGPISQGRQKYFFSTGDQPQKLMSQLDSSLHILQWILSTTQYPSLTVVFSWEGG
jgi:hypothetical protein